MSYSVGSDETAKIFIDLEFVNRDGLAETGVMNWRLRLIGSMDGSGHQQQDKRANPPQECATLQKGIPSTPSANSPDHARLATL